MSSATRSKPMRLTERMDIVRGAAGSYSRAISTTTMTYPMPLVESLLFKTAAFFVGLAMSLRRQRLTSHALPKQSATIGKPVASRSHRNFGVGGNSTANW